MNQSGVASALGAGDLRRFDDGRYIVDYTSKCARPGFPLSGGQLRLEHNPELYPIQARGNAGTPGKFWQIQYHPLLWSAIQSIKISALNTPWRLESRPLPDFAGPEDVDARQRQTDLCNRVWFAWNHSEHAFSKFLREAVWNGLVNGVYLAEYFGAWRPPARLGFDAPAEWFELALPEMRAPWAVRYWLTQNETLVGVVFGLSQSVDYPSYRRGESYVIIPAEKLLIAPGEEFGSNFEGTSFLRSIYNAAQRLIEVELAEGLNVEVYGTGELWVLDKDRELSDPEIAAWETYIASRKASGAPGGVVRGNVEPRHSTPANSMPDLRPVADGAAQTIDRALNAEHRAIGTQGTGSYAARADASGENVDKMDYYVTQYAGQVIERALHKAVQINFPEDVENGLVYAPRVRYGTVEENDVTAVVNNARSALEGGLLTHPVLGPHFAEMLDLPDISAVGIEGVSNAIQ